MLERLKTILAKKELDEDKQKKALVKKPSVPVMRKPIGKEAGKVGKKPRISVPEKNEGRKTGGKAAPPAKKAVVPKPAPIKEDKKEEKSIVSPDVYLKDVFLFVDN
jgi:hypothetical protein